VDYEGLQSGGRFFNHCGETSEAHSLRIDPTQIA